MHHGDHLASTNWMRLYQKRAIFLLQSILLLNLKKLHLLCMDVRFHDPQFTIKFDKAENYMKRQKFTFDLKIYHN